jgi:HK97 family phage prohead protease
MSLISLDYKFSSEIKDTGKFEGYASTFQDIDGGGDIVIPGAFANTIKNKQGNIPLLWQHDSSLPIGVIEKMQEDENGLFVEGQLVLSGVSKATEAFNLLKAGAIQGLSIGYRTIKSTKDAARKGVRILQELDLIEVSLVTFPMNKNAKVSFVKSGIENIDDLSIKEFEGFLRDSGFSRKQATIIASNGFRGFNQGDPEMTKSEMILNKLCAMMR